MRNFLPNIERHMRKTEGRWKLLRFVQQSGTIGAVACLVMLAAGVAMWRGWVRNPYMALGLLWMLGVAAFAVWLIVGIIFASRGAPRPWLARHLEKSHRPLLDRLNTLVFLAGEKQKRNAATHSYLRRIETQASGLLENARPKNPFSIQRPLLHVLAFALALAATVAFYDRFQPVGRLMEAWNSRPGPSKETAAGAQGFKLPDADSAEEKKPWSEVRITDPGSDIKATKVDVVPLEIEAASSATINKVSWALSVDGGKEQPRTLAAPAEPHYAVYQPTVSLDELQLSDWDVVSYYAKSTSGGGDPASSDIFFIEIRPFREDLMKMPGGEGGKAAKTLDELGVFIARQRLILRQTHHYDQQPASDLKVREGDRKKLQDGETELGDSITQYYAKLAADFENQPIGDTLDHLAMSGTYIERATTALRNDFADQALPPEQAAFTELVATRKNFQKFVNEHPEAFNREGDPDKDPMPFSTSGQIDKIAEFRNAQKAAKDFLQKTEDKQKQLADKAKSAGSGDPDKPAESGNYSGLSKEQEDLAKSLSDFEAQNPDMFHDLGKETAAAQSAMKSAAAALKTAEARSKLIESMSGLTGQPTNGNAPSAARVTTAQEAAVNSIDELKNAFANKDTGRQLQQAHQLKDMLDKQAKDLEKAAANPGSQSPGQAAQTAKAAGKTAGELKDIVDQPGSGGAFGKPLHDALSDAQQGKLADQLDQVGKAPDAASQKSAAQDAAASLRNITKAFDASMPATMKQAQQGNPLTPDAEEALNQAMQELQSLQTGKESGKSPSPAQEAKQREDARLALVKSIPQLYGSNASTSDLLDAVNKDLKAGDQPVDVEALKKLIDQIENLRVELNDKKMEKPDKEEISHIDPSKLPAEYRERVERYFQKLSEQ